MSIKIVYVMLLLLLLVTGFKTPAVSSVVGNYSILMFGLPPYAYSSNGDVIIDISDSSPLYPGYGKGLAKDTVYKIDEVIRIENNVSLTGWNEVCVVIKSNVEGLKFYSDLSLPNDVVYIYLSGNESKYVGIEINTSQYDLGELYGSFSVTTYEGKCP